MNRGVTVLLRAVLVLIGLSASIWLLWEPHLEGRNVGASLHKIYFEDPFLAFAYVASIPFFVGLYQAFKVLGFAGQNREHTPLAVKSVRTIRHCAFALMGFVVLGEIIIMNGDSDDRAGGVMMGAFVFVASVGVAIAMARLERGLQSAMESK